MHRLVQRGLAWDGGSSKRVALLIIALAIAISVMLVAITPSSASAVDGFDEGTETVAAAYTSFGGGYLDPAGAFSYRGVSWS